MSTRKLKGLAGELFGKEVSAQTGSNALACLDQELTGYRTKPLGDTVEFLFLDGISSKVREIGIERQVVLCAFGIHQAGPGEAQSPGNFSPSNSPRWRTPRLGGASWPTSRDGAFWART